MLQPVRVNAPLFWSHVDRSDGDDACWPWTAAALEPVEDKG